MDYKEQNINWLKSHLAQLRSMYSNWEHLPLMGMNIKSRIEVVETEIKSRNA